jgi:hypothetical protein
MTMALLPAKRDGSLFDLALHHWKQPIENMFAVQALKLCSPEPGTSSEAVGVRRFAPSGGVEVMLCGSNASGFVANTLVVSCAIADEKPT